MHGFLGIIDHVLMNLSRWDKILWRMVTRKYESWKKVLVKKCFSRPGKRCLGVLPTTINGSPIWKFVYAAMPIIQSDILGVPYNGGSIHIWNDNIRGNKSFVHI
jgi:hypothetical protein